MADLKDLASRYGVLKDKLNAQDFGPNDSIIASSLMHPQEAAGRASDWLQEKMRIAAGIPNQALEDEGSWYQTGIVPSMNEQAQAGLDLAGLMQTGAMPFAPASAGGTLGTFIGKNARNWDAQAAKLAEEKLNAGADPAEVWREHLIGRMPDKTLFSEISDKEMSHVIPLNKWVNRENGQLMAPNISTAWDEAASTLTPNAPVRIKRLFEHDQLKNEYPYGFTKNYENQSIMDMPVFMQEKNNKSYGSLGDEDLTLNPSLLPKEARSTVLHELQHAIQNQEGWGKGGSPAEFELSDFSKSYWQNIYDKSNDQQSELLQSLLEKKKAGEIDNNDIRLQMESLANRNGRSIAETMLRRDKNPIESYKRLAGEAQARATQDRLDMDMAQRRENYPLAGGKLSDIPLEELIYKYEGNGPSLAIKGYHGSPHKFKEFDTAHMGTGEGGQAYGWGNYITEDPYVATTYSPQDDWMDEQLMNLYSQAERRQDYPSMEVYERYMMHERPNEVADYLKESYADYPEDLPKRLPAQKIGENLYKKQKGSHLYEVSMEFPKEREAVDPMSIEHFLDYDKPLSEQSEYVRNILQSHDPDIYHPEGLDYDPVEKGSFILQRFGSGKEGAQKLYELGIPGTTYMGEKAKVADPEGVRNFVTYSDEVPRVVTRNMNKVKPLTNEDRLNNLEKQMSAYMKTKRMPKGVDFKTGSDWYDWAYDKRDALRQKLSNDDQGYAQGGSVDKDSLQIDKPQRTPNHPTKSHIVKTMVDGKEKIIRFGEQGAETAGKPKEGESDRMTAKRESFKARHAKNIAKGKSSAAYWADKVKWAEGGSVSMEDLPFDDPDQLRLYHQAMQHFDDLMENTGGSKKMGKTEARINYNTTTKGDRDRDKDLHTLIADYGIDVGKGVNLNATMIKPMEAEGVYLGNLTGSVPAGEGRASLGLQGLHTKYSDGLSGYTAGYNGKVGDGNLSASYFEPADHNSAGRQVQLEYNMPFADGGSVSEFEDPTHERLYRRAMAHFDDMREKQNFEDNDSMIASTILHPVEAAKRYGKHLNDMYAIATDQLTDAELAAAKDAGYDEESYPLYAMEHPIFRTDAQKAQAGMEFAGLAQTGAMPFAPSTEAGVLGTITIPKKRITVTDPERSAFPEIYDRPDEIARRAAQNVAEEDPAMKRLFGVNRDDLYEIRKARAEGNEAPAILMPANPKGAKVGPQVTTRRNANRMIDTLSEAMNYPDLYKGMTSWYENGPIYDRLAQISDTPIEDFKKFQTYTGMASPGSDVLTELNRGTAALTLANQGRLDDFIKYGGIKSVNRNNDFPEDLHGVKGHMYHLTAHAKPMKKYYESGEIQMETPKVPLYIQSAGVPETGYQTEYPVGDAHWSRAVGLGDVRTSQKYDASVSTPELLSLAPWWKGLSKKLGLNSVDSQALAWGTFAPATGVDTPVGASKLELLSRKIMEAARAYNITPEEARDMILTGKMYAPDINSLKSSKK